MRFHAFHPFAGPFERLIIGLIGAWFLASTSVAYSMIRRGRWAEHREWMLRAVAGALGIATVRVAVVPIDLALTPLGAGPEVVFLHAFWIGSGVTVLAAEWWIRRTRPARASAV